MAKGRCFIGTSGWSYQALARAVLSERHGQGHRPAALLCRAVRHGRGQRHLLPADRGRDLPALARADAPGLRLRLQGQPLSHPHEAPQGRRAGRRALLRAGRGARGASSARSSSSCPAASSPIASASRPSSTRSRPGTATPSSSAIRPGSSPRSSRCSPQRDVALCLYEFAGRRRRSRSPPSFVYIRLHGPEGALPGLLQRRGAAHLGQAHPRLGQQGPRRLLLLRQRRPRLRAQERASSARNPAASVDLRFTRTMCSAR